MPTLTLEPVSEEEIKPLKSSLVLEPIENKKLVLEPHNKFTAKRAVKGFGRGISGFFEGVGGFIEAIDNFTNNNPTSIPPTIGGLTAKLLLRSTGKPLKEAAQELEDRYLQVKDPKLADKVAEGFGSAATFFIPGLGAAKGAQAIAATPRIAAWTGAGVSAVLESAVESGSTYNEAKERGVTEQDAQKAATKVFVSNLPLNLVLDKWVFNKIPEGKKITTLLKGSGQEATQEAIQQVISNVALKDPVLQGVGESALIGGIVGGGVGGVKVGVESLAKDKTLVLDPVVKLDEELNQIVPFQNTESAIEFGKKATPEQIEDLKSARNDLVIRASEAIDSNRLQDAINISTKAQFAREAVEEYEASLLPESQREASEVMIKTDTTKVVKEPAKTLNKKEAIQSAVPPTIKNDIQFLPDKETIVDGVTAKDIKQPKEVKSFIGDIGKKIRKAIPLTDKPSNIIKKQDIINNLSERLNVPVRRGLFNQKALGIFKIKPKVIRLKSGDVPVVAHEAAHYLEDTQAEISKLVQKHSEELAPLDYEPDKGRPGEGFAEYMRFYVTDPSKLEGKVNRFSKDFNQYLESNPEIKDVIEQAKNDYKAWEEMPSFMKVKSQISFQDRKPSFFGKFQKNIDNVLTDYVDQLYPIKKYTELAKKNIGQIDESENAYTLARLLEGWVGKANHFLEHKTFNANGEINGKGLKEILEIVDGKEQDFSTYLVAKRAIELSKRDIESGISKEDAEQAVKDIEKENPEFSDAAKDLQTYQDKVLRYALESGLMTEDDYVRIKAKNQEYVPFFRVVDELTPKGMFGKALAKVAKPTKKIKGSEREIIDPIESIIKNTYSIIQNSDKARVMQAMATLSNKHHELGRLFEKVPPKLTKIASINLADELSSDLKAQLGDDLDTFIDIFRPSMINQDGVITVFNKGEKEYYYVGDEVLYNSLLAMNQEEVSTFVRLLAKPASWLRAGATSLSPDFLARNPFRDQMSAFFFSKNGYIPYVDFVRGLMSVTSKDNTYWEWVRSGGMQATLVSMDRNYLKKNIKDIQGKNRLKYLNPLYQLQALSEFGELATRMGEFKRAKKKGKSTQQAAFDAREVSLDFQRKGAKIKQLNMITAFLNANIQGLDKFVRTFKEQPSTTFVKSVLGITLPSLLLYLLNRDDERYKALPNWEKDLFWHIPLGDDPNDPIIKLPKPFEVGVLFGSIPERALQFAETKDPEGLKKTTTSFLNGITPPLMPTAIKPVIENVTNYSFFFGNNLESKTLQRLVPEERYYRTTSETAKKLGLTFGVSPIKIENLIRGYSGGVGSLTLKMIDYAGGNSKDNPLPLSSEQVPVLRAFLSKSPFGSRSQQVQVFFDRYEKIEQKYNTWKLKEGEDAKRYLSDNPEIKNYNLIRKYRNILFKNQKSITNALDNKALTPQQRLRIVEKHSRNMTKQASEALRVIND